MKYLSVCSGIEAASVAWRGLGFEPVGFSEIEPFTSAVLAYRFPHVKNYGDMTKFKEWEINEQIELIVGGTPCQSFSFAGLRRGIEDPRGNLMLTFGAIAHHFKPRFIVWENVPGVLSTNGGRDFGAFLGMLEECGYGFAYRVLDAQFFGVPQRRRRVFVVGCLGDWSAPAKILFEPESLRGDIAQSRKSWKDIAMCITRGVGPRYDPETETLVVHGIPGNWIGRKPENGGNAVEPMHNIAPCLTKTDIHGVQSGSTVRLLTPVECERLQGFPDNWTRIPWRGKPEADCPDGPRYKACGNSMAVPVMRWIGERIKKRKS